MSKAAVVKLRKAFGLGSSQALIRLVCSFISVKLTAVYLGPGGLALVAQFNNLISLGQGLLGAGANTAMVRLTAEYKDEPTRQRQLWSTGLKLALLLALAAVLLLGGLSPWLAERLFAESGYEWAMWLAGVGVAFSLLNNLVQGVLNGQRQIAAVVKANVLGTVFGLLVFAPASMCWGTRGGIVGSLLSYGIALAITFRISRASGTQAEAWKSRWSQPEFRRILDFYPMLVAHATLTPLAMILVRDSVIGSLGLQAGGLWQAAWRLSEVYTGIITTSVSLYFMPRLGELARQPKALSREVWQTLLTVSLVTGVLALCIYLLRDLVVHLVFSAAFEGVQGLMPVQLLGDVLKMAAWTLGFVLVATLRSRWYMAIEVLVPSAFVLGVRGMTPMLGAGGATWAYVLASGLQLVLAILALRRLLFSPAQLQALEEEMK